MVGKAGLVERCKQAVSDDTGSPGRTGRSDPLYAGACQPCRSPGYLDSLMGGCRWATSGEQ